MAYPDPKDSGWSDRQVSNTERGHGDDCFIPCGDDEFAPDLAEQFLRHVMEYEKAPCTTHFLQLEGAGVELPPPERVSEGQLTGKLRDVIAGLARLGVFLSNTDHLSDRDLYVSLWTEGLREPVVLTVPDEHFACNLDLLGSGSARDIYLHLKYYADDEYRRAWEEQFPEGEIPAHEKPPFDRDRHLPRATYAARGQLEGAEPMDCARAGGAPEDHLTGLSGGSARRPARSRRRYNRKNPSS